MHARPSSGSEDISPGLGGVVNIAHRRNRRQAGIPVARAYLRTITAYNPVFYTIIIIAKQINKRVMYGFIVRRQDTRLLIGVCERGEEHHPIEIEVHGIYFFCVYSILWLPLSIFTV